MGSVDFPGHVEAFIAATDRYLGFFEARLGPPAENPEQQLRVFPVATPDSPVELIVHRTQRSFDRPIGEYRGRLIAPLRPDFAQFVRGKTANYNCFATLGAIVTTEDSANVLCQCLIEPGLEDSLAGVLAAAAILARPSLVGTIRSVLAGAASPPVTSLSAWTDFDFEKLNYDHAHLGVGSAGSRRWMMSVPPGMASIEAVHDHPYWGGGLVCRTRIARKSLVDDDRPVDVDAMNKWANIVDDTPTFGAWCLDGDDVVFTQQLPNPVRSLPDVTDLVVAWARRRIESAPELVEVTRKFG